MGILKQLAEGVINEQELILALRGMIDDLICTYESAVEFTIEDGNVRGVLKVGVRDPEAARDMRAKVQAGCR